MEYNRTTLYPNDTIQFKLSQHGYYTIGFSFLVIGVFGIASNCVTLVMFAKESTLRTSVDAVLANLALIDITRSFICIVFLVTSSFAQRWLTGDFGCTMFGFLSFMMGNASISTLSAISVERYFVICKKHQGSILQRRVFLIKVIGFIWFHAVLWAMLPILFGVDYAKEPFQTSCTVNWQGKRLVDRLFILGMMTVVVGGNTAVMLYCYVRIFITVKSDPADIHVVRNFVDTKVCFCLVAAFTLCWMPYAVVSMWGAYGDPHSIPQVAMVIPVVIAKMSTCTNPLLYILHSRRFRKRYLDTLRCRRANRLYPSTILTIQTHFREYRNC